jgi:hypothetical protein
MFNFLMVKCTHRTLKEQNLPGTLPPELTRLRYLQTMYVIPKLSLTSKLTILFDLFYIFDDMYLYIILLDKLFLSLFLSLYYSDLSRNYLNGTIPKQWGSMMNISRMYDLSRIFLFRFLIIDCLIYYTRSIFRYGS